MGFTELAGTPATCGACVRLWLCAPACHVCHALPALLPCPPLPPRWACLPARRAARRRRWWTCSARRWRCGLGQLGKSSSQEKAPLLATAATLESVPPWPAADPTPAAAQTPAASPPPPPCPAQAVAKDVPAAELERAKAAAVSSVLMNLESRAVVAEDIGRQVLTYGHRCVWVGPVKCVYFQRRTSRQGVGVCLSRLASQASKGCQLHSAVQPHLHPARSRLPAQQAGGRVCEGDPGPDRQGHERRREQAAQVGTLCGGEWSGVGWLGSCWLAGRLGGRMLCCGCRLAYRVTMLLMFSSRGAEV